MPTAAEEEQSILIESLVKRYILFLVTSEGGMEQPPLKKRRLMNEADDIEPMEVDPPGSKEEPMEVDPPVEDDLMEVDPPPSGHTAHLSTAARPVRKRMCPRCHRRGTRIRPPPVKWPPRRWR